MRRLLCVCVLLDLLVLLLFGCFFLRQFSDSEEENWTMPQFWKGLGQRGIIGFRVPVILFFLCHLIITEVRVQLTAVFRSV